MKMYLGRSTTKSPPHRVPTALDHWLFSQGLKWYSSNFFNILQSNHISESSLTRTNHLRFASKIPPSCLGLSHLTSSALVPKCILGTRLPDGSSLHDEKWFPKRQSKHHDITTLKDIISWQSSQRFLKLLHYSTTWTIYSHLSQRNEVNEVTAVTQVSFRYFGKLKDKVDILLYFYAMLPFSTWFHVFQTFLCAFCSWFGGFFHLKCQLWYHTRRTCLRALQLPLKSCHGGPKFQTAWNSTNRTWTRMLRRALWLCPLERFANIVTPLYQCNGFATFRPALTVLPCFLCLALCYHPNPWLVPDHSPRKDLPPPPNGSIWSYGLQICQIDQDQSQPAASL